MGTKSNRAGIGARLSVTTKAPDGRTRLVHRQVDAGGSFGASPLQQHVGLGEGVRRADVEVWWPASGQWQRLQDVAVNQVIEIEEGREGYRALARPALALRQAAAP